ncbi:MAG: 3-deoxy-7-phosphoheptulonate synthase [Rhodothermales bacterium]|jgi:3-deoxy-7-phosphoheptulonate synthase
MADLLPALQQPDYPDQNLLDDIAADLSRRPPLVTSWEVDRLRGLLAKAATGKQFLLQGGDCAERFDECRADVILGRLKILLQMSLVLIHGLRLPVIRVGRFAGQYAKPRSEDTEIIDGVELKSYRGDIINGPEADVLARLPDPRRMLEAYGNSAMTLNFVRALVDGGFADLHHPQNWDLGFVEPSGLKREYQEIVDGITGALRFMETVSNTTLGDVERVDFYTSHEALLLPYEQALTRQVPSGGTYNLSTHFPWIGLRTSEPSGAHVTYAAGIRNPLGIKVGPDTEPSTLKRLLNSLDPDHEAGRLSLITRFGVDRASDALPRLIAAVQSTGRTVLWSCDPMHGNTEVTQDGLKTRRFENVLGELEQVFAIHDRYDSILGGVHFELTGENVTECIGGSGGLTESDLSRAYRSHVDPRLNAEQALEMAFSIVKNRKSEPST